MRAVRALAVLAAVWIGFTWPAVIVAACILAAASATLLLYVHASSYNAERN